MCLISFMIKGPVPNLAFTRYKLRLSFYLKFDISRKTLNLSIVTKGQHSYRLQVSDQCHNLNEAYFNYLI